MNNTEGYCIPGLPWPMDNSAFTHKLSSSCRHPAVNIHTLKTPACFPQEKQSGLTCWPFLDWHWPLRGTNHLPSCPWARASSASDMWPSELWERWERPTAPSYLRLRRNSAVPIRSCHSLIRFLQSAQDAYESTRTQVLALFKRVYLQGYSLLQRWKNWNF